MSEIGDTFVTSDDIQAANDASSFLFTIPPDAAKKGDPTQPDGGKATWTQSLNVTATKVEHGNIEDKKNSVMYTGLTVEVEFTVPPDATRVLKTGEVIVDPNAGRSLRQWYKLIDGAQGNKSHPKYKAFYFNLARLKGIIESAGWTVPSGGFSIKQYFSGDVLLSAHVNTLMTRSWFEGKAKDEISDFIRPATAAA